MFSHFPQIRDQESTYSIFSRLQFAIQPSNTNTMGIMIFNRKNEIGSLNFQGSLDYLCSNLPSKFTIESFIINNTIFPIFMPFSSTEQQNISLELFKGDSINKINNHLKIKYITNAKRFIRVCKECIKEDFNIYGEPYYRRQHEIELNRVCYKHKIPLWEYTIFPYKLPRKFDDFFTVLSNSKEVVIPKDFMGKFIDIADDINTIFTSSLEKNYNIKTTRDKIIRKIIEKGFITDTKISVHYNIAQKFKKYYTENFLDYIKYNFDAKLENSWIRNITATNREFKNDPIKYILFIRWLFGSFKDFYQYDTQNSIFKQGPYPCLNMLCPHYNKLVIKDIKDIYININHPVATFECNNCGYIYVRRGPDKYDNDIYTKKYVKHYGHL
jgi:hypothetical protein